MPSVVEQDFVSSLIATPPEPPTGYSISGTISGVKVSSVIVRLYGPVMLAAISGVDGTYTIPSVPPGTYTLTAESHGFAFSPLSAEVTIDDANVSDVDFEAALGVGMTGIFTGNITGATREGVMIRYADVNNTRLAGHTFTDANGFYSFASNFGTYSGITPTKVGYTFNPTFGSVPAAGRVQNFVATAI